MEYGCDVTEKAIGRDGANVKIFSGQGPDGYMRNVVYKEVLKM